MVVHLHVNSSSGATTSNFSRVQPSCTCCQLISLCRISGPMFKMTGAVLLRSSPATMLYSHRLDPVLTSCWLGRSALSSKTPSKCRGSHMHSLSITL